MHCLCDSGTAGVEVLHVFPGRSRYNGKCKKCGSPLSILAQKANLRIDVAAMKAHPLARWWGTHVYTASYFDDQQRTWPDSMASDGPIVICPTCGAAVHLHPVAGKFNPSKICSSKCVNATGFVCECSCGGANHGAGGSF